MLKTPLSRRNFMQRSTAFAAAVAAGAILHAVVEKPSVRLGRRLEAPGLERRAA